MYNDLPAAYAADRIQITQAVQHALEYAMSEKSYHRAKARTRQEIRRAYPSEEGEHG